MPEPLLRREEVSPANQIGGDGMSKSWWAAWRWSPDSSSPTGAGSCRKWTLKRSYPAAPRSVCCASIDVSVDMTSPHSRGRS